MQSAETQLKTLQEKGTPTQEFKAVLWIELEREFKREYPQFLIVWRRAIAIPVMFVLMFIMTGAGTYAYASPEVTQAHLLYPVKRGIETVESQFYRTDVSQTQFHTRMLERRLDEGAVLVNQHQLTGEYLGDVMQQYRALNERPFMMPGRMEHARNKVVIIRVRIDESDFTEEERALLEQIILEQINF